jgi:signal peptidase I
VNLRHFLLGANPRRTLIRTALILLSAYIVFQFVLLPVRLQGISMLPTYFDGSINFANRLAFVFHDPERGDVVAIRMAGPSVVIVKRIVGLPGERIAIIRGIVTINGEPLAEPSIVYRAPWNAEPVELGENEYFVIGDNRGMRMENHEFGRTTRDRIVGELLF